MNFHFPPIFTKSTKTRLKSLFRLRGCAIMTSLKTLHNAKIRVFFVDFVKLMGRKMKIFLPLLHTDDLIKNIFHTYDFEVFIMKYMLSSTKINKSLGTILHRLKNRRIIEKVQITLKVTKKSH